MTITGAANSTFGKIQDGGVPSWIWIFSHVSVAHEDMCIKFGLVDIGIQRSLRM